tara:strand:- start:180 stop:503 length:324 start_codon:yes stop_codon:yes gene_type:complete
MKKFLTIMNINCRWILYIVLIICYQNEVKSNNFDEIENFCSSQIEYENCFRNYQGLPPVNSPPTLYGESPIELKVIPYQKKTKNYISTLNTKKTNQTLLIDEAWWEN